jgi:hypothetical protein
VSCVDPGDAQSKIADERLSADFEPLTATLGA